MRILDQCKGELEGLYALIQAELDKEKSRILQKLEELKAGLTTAEH